MKKQPYGHVHVSIELCALSGMTVIDVTSLPVANHSLISNVIIVISQSQQSVVRWVTG